MRTDLEADADVANSEIAYVGITLHGGRDTSDGTLSGGRDACVPRRAVQVWRVQQVRQAAVEHEGRGERTNAQGGTDHCRAHRHRGAAPSWVQRQADACG